MINILKFVKQQLPAKQILKPQILLSNLNASTFQSHPDLFYYLRHPKLAQLNLSVPLQTHLQDNLFKDLQTLDVDLLDSSFQWLLQFQNRNAINIYKQRLKEPRKDKLASAKLIRNQTAIYKKTSISFMPIYQFQLYYQNFFDQVGKANIVELFFQRPTCLLLPTLHKSFFMETRRIFVQKYKERLTDLLEKSPFLEIPGWKIDWLLTLIVDQFEPQDRIFVKSLVDRLLSLSMDSGCQNISMRTLSQLRMWRKDRMIAQIGLLKKQEMDSRQLLLRFSRLLKLKVQSLIKKNQLYFLNGIILKIEQRVKAIIQQEAHQLCKDNAQTLFDYQLLQAYLLVATLFKINVQLPAGIQLSKLGRVSCLCLQIQELLCKQVSEHMQTAFYFAKSQLKVQIQNSPVRHWARTLQLCSGMKQNHRQYLFNMDFVKQGGRKGVLLIDSKQTILNSGGEGDIQKQLCKLYFQLRGMQVKELKFQI